MQNADRLIRLATANVRQYTRFERGKQEVVRPHTETRADAAKEGGWIPQAKWQAGQQEWVKEGEAAWKARGAEHAAQAKAHDAAADAAQKAASAHREAAEASQRAADPWAAMRGAVKQRPRPEPSARPSDPWAARQEAVRKTPSLQTRVEQAERARRGLEQQAGQHPLFSRPGAGSPEQAVSNAADQAVRDAAVQGGLDSKQLDGIFHEIADLRARLTSAEGAESRVEEKQKMKGRAELALGIMGLLAGILIAALTGGVAAIVGEVMIFKWAPELAIEFTKYFGVELNKGHTREVLANPHTTVKKVIRSVPVPHRSASPLVSHSPAKAAKSAQKAAGTVRLRKTSL